MARTRARHAVRVKWNRWFYLVALACVILAGPGWAQQDVMTIAFDAGGEVTCADAIAPGAMFDIYLLLLDASHPQVAAWECMVQWDQMGGSFAGQWEITNNGLNIGDLSDPEAMLFAVGIGANPLNTGGVTVLAHWNGLFLSGTGSRFYLHPYPGGSFPNEGLPGYAADTSTLVPCSIASGDESTPVALLGEACAGNAERTWSAVKRDYQ